MSRQLHIVEITEEQFTSLHKARLVAAAMLVVFFSAFVAFAPEGDSKPAPDAVAAAPENVEDVR